MVESLVSCICQLLKVSTYLVINVISNGAKNFFSSTGFPLGLEKLENLEKWEGIFQSGKSQGILNRLEKSGKTTQNTGKLRKFHKKIICYFSMIFK